MKYYLSKNMRFLDVSGRVAAYHRIHGNLSVLTSSQHDFLLAHDSSTPDSQCNMTLLREFADLKYVTRTEEENTEIDRMRTHSLERAQRIQNFKGLILKATDACNFGCSYCIDSASGLEGTTGNMKPEIAHAAIDHFLQFCRRHQKYENGGVTIGFNGGEPLINVHLIKSCITFIKDNHPDALIKYDINTNAALITPDVAKFLKRHDFAITTSLDGAILVNDAQRNAKARNTSAFVATVGGVQNLNAIDYSSHVTTLAVLTEKNIDKIDRSFLEYVRGRLGVRRLLLEPDMSRQLPMSPRYLAQKVYTIKDMAQGIGGLIVGGGWCMPFLSLIKKSAHKVPSYCSALSGFSINVFPDGDIRVCNYLDAPFTLLNLRDVMRFEDIIDHESFVRSIHDNYGCAKAECAGCHIRGLCKGGCLVTAARGKKVKAYHCDFLREITDMLIRECVVANSQDRKEVR